MAVVSAVLGTVIVLIYCTAVLVNRKKQNNKGPWGLPLVGNLHQVFGPKPFLTFAEWAKRFGDVFFLKLGNQQAVVLSSIDAAREALVTKGKIFAGRPPFNTMDMLHGDERRFVFAPQVDEMLKLFRKTLLTDIRKRAAVMEPIVEQEVDKMAAELFPAGTTETVVDMRNILHRVAANVAYGFAFGKTFDLNDPTLHEWEAILDEHRELQHWFRVENFVPYSHLILRDFHNQALEFREKSVAMYKTAIQRCRELRKAQGSEAEVGAMAALLDMYAEYNMTDDVVDDDIASILRDVMFGASDGSYQPLIWMVLYTARETSVQKGMMREIQEVLGDTRMPTLADRESMPYVEATIREILRHSEITSLGIPRRCTEDTSIAGQDVAKDTLVVVNVYAIHRDGRQWKDPSKFDPERFLDDNGELLPLGNLSFLPFSTGHRACPGQNLTKNFLFLLFARFFQQFEILPAHGEDIPQMINEGGAFNPELRPFKVLIRKKNSV